MPSTALSTIQAPTLRTLVDGQASASELASHLDALEPADRLREVLACRGKRVGQLYAAVASAAPASVEEFMPANVEGTRIYEGRNSLPLFSRFQKRFQRIEDGRIIGYNHQTMSFFTGPGYFVLEPASGDGLHKDEFYFDYTQDVGIRPEGWPRYKSNNRGLSKLVYGGMKDYMRRVARGVFVGKAYQHGIDRGAYFSLTFI